MSLDFAHTSGRRRISRPTYPVWRMKNVPITGLSELDIRQAGVLQLVIGLSSHLTVEQFGVVAN